MSGRLGHLINWLEQVDFQSTQVIIVHDKRDETTGYELKSIVSKINSPALILNESVYGTAGGARNSALGECEGEWICFWDSDDQPNYQLVLNGLDSNYDVIIGEFSIEKPLSLVVKVPHGEDRENSLSRMSFNPGLWRMAFRADVIQNLKFPEIMMGEDQCFLAQLEWNSLRTKFVNENYYNYFSGWDSQTTSKDKSRLPLLESLRFLRGLLEDNKGTEEVIRNMASRQFLTLLKTKGIKAKFLSIAELFKLMGSPTGFLMQLKSLRDMLIYLIKSSRA
jgi:glycosyltransferase involved in cell wall biosynthesis